MRENIYYLGVTLKRLFCKTQRKDQKATENTGTVHAVSVIIKKEHKGTPETTGGALATTSAKSKTLDIRVPNAESSATLAAQSNTLVVEYQRGKSPEIKEQKIECVKITSNYSQDKTVETDFLPFLEFLCNSVIFDQLIFENIKLTPQDLKKLPGILNKLKSLQITLSWPFINEVLLYMAVKNTKLEVKTTVFHFTPGRPLIFIGTYPSIESRFIFTLKMLERHSEQVSHVENKLDQKNMQTVTLLAETCRQTAIDLPDKQTRLLKSLETLSGKSQPFSIYKVPEDFKNNFFSVPGKTIYHPRTPISDFDSYILHLPEPVMDVCKVKINCPSAAYYQFLFYITFYLKQKSKQRYLITSPSESLMNCLVNLLTTPNLLELTHPKFLRKERANTYDLKHWGSLWKEDIYSLRFYREILHPLFVKKLFSHIVPKQQSPELKLTEQRSKEQTLIIIDMAGGDGSLGVRILQKSQETGIRIKLYLVEQSKELCEDATKNFAKLATEYQEKGIEYKQEVEIIHCTLQQKIPPELETLKGQVHYLTNSGGTLNVHMNDFENAKIHLTLLATLLHPQGKLFISGYSLTLVDKKQLEENFCVQECTALEPASSRSFGILQFYVCSKKESLLAQYEREKALRTV